jgi:hypothetical protein
MNKNYLIDRAELFKVPFNYGSMFLEGGSSPQQTVTVAGDAQKVVPVLSIQNQRVIKRHYPKSISRF